MAVANIDTVYQRVLALANKEQRGYITPQEFNLLAGKAQNDIFEMYFHDYKTALLSPGNQSKSADDIEMLREKIAMHRVIGGVVSDTGITPSDVHWLESVYGKYQSKRVYTITTVAGSNIVLAETSSNFTRISLRAYYDGTGEAAEGEGYYHIYFTNGGELTSAVNTVVAEALGIQGNIASYSATQMATIIANVINDHSPYHSATSADDVVTITYNQGTTWTGSEVISYGGGMTSDVDVATTAGSDLVYEEVDRELWQYIKYNKRLNPLTSRRGIFQRLSSNMLELTPNPGASTFCDYIKRPADPKWGYVVVNEKALYNSFTTIGFELHASEESTLTNKILELAGIVINKPGLSEVILRNEAVKEANENK
jgi:hypothetical protein